MKKLLALAIGAAFSLSAFAAPVDLPAGPLYMKFNGNEQIAINGANTWEGGEINWGVFTLTTIMKGVVQQPGEQIDGSTDPDDIIFNNGDYNGQITGMFYGLEAGIPTETNPFPATGGYIDLYWRDLGTYSATNNAELGPDVRCGFSCANGYTQGEFLVRLKFASGIDPDVETNYVSGSVRPVEGEAFAGDALSFAEVDYSVMGTWTEKLDTDWFNTVFGSRDFRFSNRYSENVRWDGGENIIGARLDDPAQAVALPEPGALSLMGLAMVGMGAALRRRTKK